MDAAAIAAQDERFEFPETLARHQPMGIADDGQVFMLERKGEGAAKIVAEISIPQRIIAGRRPDVMRGIGRFRREGMDR